MKPVPHGTRLLAIVLPKLFARDLKRGREIHPITWSSELQACKNLSIPPPLPPSQDSFSWLLNPFFGMRLWGLG